MEGNELSTLGKTWVKVGTACAIIAFLVMMQSIGSCGSQDGNPVLNRSAERAVSLLQNIASNASVLVNVYMDARASDMLACAATSEPLKSALLKPALKADAKAVLAQLQDTYRAYDALLLLDRSGLCVASAPAGLEGKDLSADSAFKGALAGKLGFSDVHKSSTVESLNQKSKGWTAAIAAPVKVGNDVKGVLFSYLDWARLQKLVSSVQVGQSGYVFFLNGQNRVILHPAGSVFYGVALDDARVKLASLNEAVTRRAPFHAYYFENLRSRRQDTKLVGLAYPEGYGNFPGFGWSVGASADRTEIAPQRSLMERLFE